MGDRLKQAAASCFADRLIVDQLTVDDGNGTGLSWKRKRDRIWITEKSRFLSFAE
jgi:hypothetical protein